MSNVEVKAQEVDPQTLQKGSIITCPHCSLLIGRVVKDLKQGEKITSAHFEGPGIRKSSPAKCFKCGMPWILGDLGRIHTHRGWFPPDSSFKN